MAFELRWTREARATFDKLEAAAKKSNRNRRQRKKSKSSPQEGLFKQIAKSIRFLRENPKHPSLRTHVYSDLEHPWDNTQNVWEAYAQNQTASAYRIFWCYGPESGCITIIAITPHP